jgi:hypothetical protein
MFSGSIGFRVKSEGASLGYFFLLGTCRVSPASNVAPIELYRRQSRGNTGRCTGGKHAESTKHCKDSWSSNPSYVDSLSHCFGLQTKLVPKPFPNRQLDANRFAGRARMLSVSYAPR